MFCVDQDRMKSWKRLLRAKKERILLLFVAKEVFRTAMICEKSVVLGFRVRNDGKDVCKNKFCVFKGILAIKVNIFHNDTWRFLRLGLRRNSKC